MRGGVALVALAASLLTPPAAAAELKLNQVQMVGTAESYKLAPSREMLSLIRMGGKKDVQALDFGLPPIAVQLDAGAQALSFDIVNDPDGGLFKNPAGASMAGELLTPEYVSAMSQPGFKVMHVPDVDFNSSCLTLKACFSEIAAWRKTHPGHAPLVIVLHGIEKKTPIPGGTKPLAFDADAVSALDKQIASSFPKASILTPASVKAGVWPTLAQSRGKLIFVLDGPAHDSALLFAASHDEKNTQAAFVVLDNPIKDAQRIKAAIASGLMVITRADDETFEARANDTRRRDQALASGAQVIRTNFPLADARIGPYQVSAQRKPEAANPLRTAKAP